MGRMYRIYQVSYRGAPPAGILEKAKEGALELAIVNSQYENIASTARVISHAVQGS